MDYVGPGGIPPDFQQLVLGLQKLAASRLVRVVAIGQEITTSDARVELIALEVRDTAAIIGTFLDASQANSSAGP